MFSLIARFAPSVTFSQAALTRAASTLPLQSARVTVLCRAASSAAPQAAASAAPMPPPAMKGSASSPPAPHAAAHPSASSPPAPHAAAHPSDSTTPAPPHAAALHSASASASGARNPLPAMRSSDDMLSGGGVPHLLDLFSPTSMLSPTWALDLQGAQRDSFVVEETEQEFKLSLQVPGLHKKNLKVVVDPGAHTLSIKGHATVGGTSVHTSFFLDLPANVVADPAHKATASLASGILQLTFAKCAPTPPSKLHKLDIEEQKPSAKRPHKASPATSK